MAFRKNMKSGVLCMLAALLLFVAACGGNVDTTQSFPVSSSPQDSTNECKYGKSVGDLCGIKCPADQCEDRRYNDGVPFDSWIDFTLVYDGTCQSGSGGLYCERVSCMSTATLSSSPAETRCIDSDGDAIINNDDYDDFTPPGCNICNYDEIGTANCLTPDRVGVSEDSNDPSCTNSCMMMDSTGSVLPMSQLKSTGPINLQIMITPCNFDPSLTGMPQQEFEDHVTYIATELGRLEPFSSSPDKYIVTYLWPSEDPFGIGQDQKKCENDKILYELGSRCKLSQNILYVNIILSDGGHGGGANIALESDESKSRFKFYTPRLEIDKDHYMYVFLHEIGHLFNFNHATVGQQDILAEDCKADFDSIHFSNDIFVSEVPNNPMKFNENPCPLWIGEDFTKWRRAGESIGCYPYYVGCRNYYKPWLEGDALSSGYEPDKDIIKYNPVQRKYIFELLSDGYVNYIKKSHPNRCFDLENPESFNTCIISECMFIPKDDNDRQTCCSRIVDQNFMNACLTQELPASDFIMPTPMPEINYPEYPTFDENLEQPLESDDVYGKLSLPAEPLPYSLTCGAPAAQDYDCSFINTYSTDGFGKNIDDAYSPIEGWPNPPLTFYFNPPMTMDLGLKMFVQMGNLAHTTSADIDVKMNFFDEDYTCHFNYVDVDYSDAGYFMLIDLLEQCPNHEGLTITEIVFKPMASNVKNIFSDVSFYYDPTMVVQAPPPPPAPLQDFSNVPEGLAQLNDLTLVTTNIACESGVISCNNIIDKDFSTKAAVAVDNNKIYIQLPYPMKVKDLILLVNAEFESTYELSLFDGVDEICGLSWVLSEIYTSKNDIIRLGEFDWSNHGILCQEVNAHGIYIRFDGGNDVNLVAVLRNK